MQQMHSIDLGRVISTKQYTVEITNEALADMEQLYNHIVPERFHIMDSEPEHSKEIRRMLVDNYSVFYTIKDNRVIVTDVLYSASDIESRLKG